MERTNNAHQESIGRSPHAANSVIRRVPEASLRGINDVDESSSDSVIFIAKETVVNEGSMHRQVPDETPGPSGARDPNEGSASDDPIEVEVENGQPEVRSPATNKMSRGQAWRATLHDSPRTRDAGIYRRDSFTADERRIMINYLIKKNCVEKAKGLVIWQKLIKDGFLTSRTPQSLQNHFRKKVLPEIQSFDWLRASEIRKFLALKDGPRRPRK